jgi:hypothetical protein
LGAAQWAVLAVGLAPAAARQVTAMSDATATGLIVGLGLGGSSVLVLGLTIRAARMSNREARAERAAADQVGLPRARAGRSRTRTRSHSAAGVDTTGYDPYPPQPYSAHEPKSHKPYSRPYRPPVPDQQHSHAKTNGHHPPGPVGVPTTPWDPTDE